MVSVISTIIASANEGIIKWEAFVSLSLSKIAQKYWLYVNEIKTKDKIRQKKTSIKVDFGVNILYIGEYICEPYGLGGGISFSCCPIIALILALNAT